MLARPGKRSIKERTEILHGISVYLSQKLALIGGVTLLGLVAMTVVSVVGRKFGLPIYGDVELTEMIGAVAAAAFLPLCTSTGAHIKVTFFDDKLPPVLLHSFDALAELAVGLITVLLAWRTNISAVDLFHTKQVSLILGLPLWIAVAAVVPCLFLMAYCAFVNAICIVVGVKTDNNMDAL